MINRQNSKDKAIESGFDPDFYSDTNTVSESERNYRSLSSEILADLADLAHNQTQKYKDKLIKFK